MILLLGGRLRNFGVRSFPADNWSIGSLDGSFGLSAAGLRYALKLKTTVERPRNE
jgi:hypothetical protein